MARQSGGATRAAVPPMPQARACSASSCSASFGQLRCSMAPRSRRPGAASARLSRCLLLLAGLLLLLVIGRRKLEPPRSSAAAQGSRRRSGKPADDAQPGRPTADVGHEGKPTEDLKPTKLTDDILRRCEGTLGDWCTAYFTQRPVPARAPPRGNLTCSMDCNQVGTCSALTGRCTCPAGWTGFNCVLPMKRHCTHRWRHFGFDAPKLEPDLAIGTREGVGLFHLPTSHCGGECDSDLAACYCPSNTTYGRIPAAPEAAPGSPPQRRGRPMGLYCQPSQLPDGTTTTWGMVDPQRLWGPEGWCQAPSPEQRCSCYDGWGGLFCQLPVEQFCFNSCNGRGECVGGYCKCDPGWHGIDCAHRSARAKARQPARQHGDRPWLADLVHTPAARRFKAGETRRRPLIYVYELPSEYGTLMLQYRLGGTDCVPRAFSWMNETELSEWTYTTESLFLEALLQSEHRTLDPEEADFFYVPVFTSCLIYPIRRMADSLRDTWYGLGPMRVHSAANMLLEAFHWVQAHHAYWQRSGGKDHIFLVTHDEGSCWVPSALRPAIILSHWGRTDANHTSGTGYWEDVYDQDWHHPQWEPKSFLPKLGSQPCFDPEKDLVIPIAKTPDHFHASPLIGAPARHRTWLAFHRGQIKLDNTRYSRGLRQRLYNASREHGWRQKHAILFGTQEEIPGDYSGLLASSVFCLVLPGDGWSARVEDAMLNGCIPVIVMDGVQVQFESVLDLSACSLRVPEAEAERLPEILKAVSQERRREMQRSLARIWQRFAYSSYRPHAKRFRELQAGHAAARQEYDSVGSSSSRQDSSSKDSRQHSSRQGSSSREGDDQDSWQEVGGEDGWQDDSWGDEEEEGEENGSSSEQGGRRRLRGKRGGRARAQKGEGEPELLPATVPDLDPAADDAFATIMGWLHSRIPATRGDGRR